MFIIYCSAVTNMCGSLIVYLVVFYNITSILYHVVFYIILYYIIRIICIILLLLVVYYLKYCFKLYRIGLHYSIVLCSYIL
jgi:hypothetical protein